MVLAAILGHVLVTRRLLADRRAVVAAPAAPAERMIAKALMLALLAVTLGCSSRDPAAPALTRLVGSVTLLGQEDPGTPVGARLTLFLSREDLETGNAAYEIPLASRSGTNRTFDFASESVGGGQYFVSACFAFGCGQHRDPHTGQLIPVAVVAGRTNTLHLAF
jgi:hypothetical protein